MVVTSHVSTHVDTVELFHTPSQRHVDADLYQGLMPRDIEDIERLWNPPINQALEGIKTRFRDGELQTDADVRHALALQAIQDSHWDWRQKCECLEGIPAYESFVLRCQDRTQGVMIVNKQGVARLGPQDGSQTVYIDYLATAPWNRGPLNGGVREYKGVGVVMIVAAISLSIDEGLGGRIGLHSLPQAHGFYANKLGMHDLGVDVDKQGLSYFEFAPQDARQLLEQ